MTGTNPSSLFPDQLSKVIEYLDAKRRVSGSSVALKAAQAIVAYASRLPTPVNLQIMRDFSTACRHEIGDRPKMQAFPLPKNALPLVLDRFQGNPRLRTVLFIAWKTASRLGEVTPLQRQAFLIINDETVLIDYLVTKTNRAGSWRGDHLVLLSQPASLPTWFLTVLRTLPEGEPLTNLTTSAIDKMLATIPLPQATWAPEENLTAVRPRITAHSFKRGALAVLWEAAAAGQLELRLVAQLAKHKFEAVIPDTTVGYAASKLQVALALGSHRATILL
jgi:hypothetical protein